VGAATLQRSIGWIKPRVVPKSDLSIVVALVTTIFALRIARV
jgi:hypothetical protein